MSNLLRPLSTAEVLDGAFTLYRRNFGLLVGIGAAVYALPALVTPLSPLGGGMLAWLVSFLLDGAFIWASAELIQGRAPTVRGALGIGVRRYLPLLLMTLVYVLVIGAAAALLAIPVAISGLLSGAVAALVAVPAAATFVWLMVSLFGWRQAIVIERDWNFVRRSFALAQGGRWQILWVSILGWLIVALASLPLGLGMVATGGTDAMAQMGEQSPGLTLLQFALAAVTRPFTHLLYTLLYFSRRIQVEGFDVERSVADLERALADDA